MEMQSINLVVFEHIPRSGSALIKIAHIATKSRRRATGIQLPDMSESVPLIRKRHGP
jgi:hypothetical protein